MIQVHEGTKPPTNDDDDDSFMGTTEGGRVSSWPCSHNLLDSTANNEKYGMRHQQHKQQQQQQQQKRSEGESCGQPAPAPAPPAAAALVHASCMTKLVTPVTGIVSPLIGSLCPEAGSVVLHIHCAGLQTAGR